MMNVDAWQEKPRRVDLIDRGHFKEKGVVLGTVRKVIGRRGIFEPQKLFFVIKFLV